MTAKELRIGNWIKTENPNTESQITNLGPEYLKVVIGGRNHTYFFSGNLIQGIPITEEWLINFGFFGLRETSMYGTQEFYNTGSKFKFGLGCFYVGHGDNKWEKLTCIKYVHQLQNLYFALTGTELEMK